MAKITQGIVPSSGPGKIKAWSFSVLQQYNECPAKVKFSKIDKIAEPKAPALERGTLLHSLCETFLTEGSPVPSELSKIEKQLIELRSLKAIPEAEFAFRSDWSPCSWFDKDCWLRVKADAIVPPLADGNGEARIADFKSGRLREDHSEYDNQLELYALAAFLMYPLAQIVHTELIFIDVGVTLESDRPFTRDMLPALKAKWEAAAKPLLMDETFAPRPSAQACKWCFYAKAKNGNCTY